MQNKEKEIGLRTRVTNALKWGYNFTSISGVTQVRDTNRQISKVAWMLLAFFGFGLTFWTVNKTVQNYFDFESVTTINVRNKDVIDFPSVTVCSQNRVHCKHLYNLIKTCTKVSNFMFHVMMLHIFKRVLL